MSTAKKHRDNYICILDPASFQPFDPALEPVLNVVIIAKKRTVHLDSLYRIEEIHT